MGLWVSWQIQKPTSISKIKLNLSKNTEYDDDYDQAATKVKQSCVNSYNKQKQMKSQ